ncbi:hypothetical protein RSO01_91370 [Reyranella soli]|uniref:G8 domain-containing protein n=1 Tax=Reyranella soli TaxID=1230389 RepID=A0A512NSP5_9HYPH|nr:hypothetical protein RSO01_91370 [Reyranella soli]
MAQARCCVGTLRPGPAIWLLLGLLVAMATVSPVRAQCPTPNTPAARGGDLVISEYCTLNQDAAYYYGQINIVSGGFLIFQEPATQFSNVDFWASSIVIEANGVLQIGNPTTPYGTSGGFLTIHLYGKDQSNGANPAEYQGQGVLCKTRTDNNVGPCGIPRPTWNDNGKSLLPGCGINAGPGPVGPAQKTCIPGLDTTVSDYFYQYGPLHGDGRCINGQNFNNSNGTCGAAPAEGQVGYFGYKTLAVSYDASVYIYGFKGATYDAAVDADPTNSGFSWLRLSGDLPPGVQSLKLDDSNGALGARWFRKPEKLLSQFVVTTTDYLPTHSEVFTINNVSIPDGLTVDFTEAAKWLHVGTRYPIGSRIDTESQKRLQDGGMDKDLIEKGAETRAAVALLTRSVRIVSGGDALNEQFSGYFGGHTVFRQGFRKIEIQGVEFANLGQGGKMGHYPVHFHKSRQVPPGTFVKDSSINESNTRWYVLHSTQGVTLQRNVGWKSIGHGFFLEDGTETDNNFYSNIGIFARAAIQNPQNPNRVPGILSNNLSQQSEPAGFAVRTRSDSEHPTVFWITNGWNNFVGNMAAGAGACGAAYWLVPVMNSDRPDLPTSDNTVFPNNTVGPNRADGHMKWDYDKAGYFGYAGFQTERNGAEDARFAGATPLRVFFKNSASATMMSFQTTIDAPKCNGITVYGAKSDFPTVAAVRSFAPPVTKGELPDILRDMYYPHVFGRKAATACPPLDLSKPPGLNNQNCGQFSGRYISEAPDCSAGNEQNCNVTVLSHFTSSFTWADGAVAAVWLRPNWYLFANGVITDVQNGGLNFVTGGDMTHSSLIPGYWAVAKSSVFVGHTQPQVGDNNYQTYHAFAADVGPFNNDSRLQCDPLLDPNQVPNYCINTENGVSYQLADFFVNQSLFRIYDGPNYQDGNAFLDITTSKCEVSKYNSGCIYGTGRIKGIPKSVVNDDPTNHDCYLPNAAIGWKQPNGFFYPPAFHSRNLFFGNVEIRHFVINPLVEPTQGDFRQGGTYITDEAAVSKHYCNFNSAANQTNPGTFASFTSIDRQTELNDDDGTLTGLSNTFPAPLAPLSGVPNLNQTISINEDNFFGAPIETPECASNISDVKNYGGANNLPDNACKPTLKILPPVTARTSPYDYVATVIYHAVDSNWSSDCTNPTCYGVPLYRQYLNGVDGGQGGSSREWTQWYASGCGADHNQPNCRWPFIRMAGMSIGVRETLTLNNATYYLDTAVPRDMQQKEQFNTVGGPNVSLTNSFNVFVGGDTYNVFFVYAKQSSRQTYQIYVGKGRDAASVAGSIKPIQVEIPGEIRPGPYETGAPFLFVTAKDYDPASGIVSVTVDFSDVTALAPTPDNGLCQPKNFCRKDPASGACTSALSKDDPLAKLHPAILSTSQQVCSHWAVKDLDCPTKGCLGFSFTLPNDGSFSADASVTKPTPHRPRPTAFPSKGTNPDGSPQGDPNWLTKFLKTTRTPDSASGGQCYYRQLPGTDCPIP